MWGDAGTHVVGTVQRKATTTTAYDNVDTSTAWLAGFPSSTTVEHFKGTSTTAARTAKVTRTRASTGSGGKTNAVRVETAFPDDETLKLRTTYAHDANGNVTTATTVGGTTGHVASRTTSREDFADARYPETVENALDHAVTLEWDAALGLPTRVTDANGRILNIGYDAFGREVSRERAWDGVTETTAYAACGSSCPAVSATAAACGTAAAVSADVAMKATKTSQDAPETVRYLDELGRTVRTTVESFGSSTTQRIADVLHDGRGLVACTSTPYHTGGTKRYAKYGYDARGRVTSLTRPDGGSVAVAYAAQASTSRVRATVRETVLDEDGTVLAGTRDTVDVYNVMGELVETTAGAQAASSSDRSVTRYAYDGGGLLETVTVENGASDHATTFGHDDAGNRTSVANPNFAATTFGFTGLGQLRTRTDGRGTTTWTYDVLGRTTARSDPSGGAAAWQWDPAAALGLAKKRTYDDGTSTAVEFEETYAYDGDERPTTTTTTIRKSAVAADAVTVTRTLAYDTHGRPATETTQPSALAVGYGYNARGYLSKLKRGTAALTTYTAMDARGNATGQTYGNGVATTRTFDDLGRTTGIATVKGTAKFQDETYGWRSDGLLESRAVGTGATADTEVFAYDHLGRLSGAKTYADEASPGASSTADRTLAYGYDRLGNLTSKPGATLAYAGAGNAGPNAATSANLGVATTISYDASGHVTGYDAATGDDTFVEWDGRGMASRITVGASKTTTSPTARDEFRYGPDGERYYRRTTWTETVTDDEGTSTTRTRWTEVYRVGRYEKVVGDGLGDYAWVDKTRAGAAQLVRTAATATATPTSASMSWRIPVYATITWGRVSFGIGRSFWNGEGGGFFGGGGFFRPRVSFRIGLPIAVFNAVRHTLALRQETSPADATMTERGMGATIDGAVAVAATGASILVPAYDLVKCNVEGNCDWIDWTVGVGEIAVTATGIGYGVRVLVKSGVKGASKANKIYGTPSPGQRVYRVWGGGARPFSRSWTRIDPRTAPNYRDAAGLPDSNTGRFVSEGELTDATGVIQRPALSVHGNRGGLDEVVIPDPRRQVRIERVSGVNPEY